VLRLCVYNDVLKVNELLANNVPGLPLILGNNGGSNWEWGIGIFLYREAVSYYGELC